MWSHRSSPFCPYGRATEELHRATWWEMRICRWPVMWSLSLKILSKKSVFWSMIGHVSLSKSQRWRKVEYIPVTGTQSVLLTYFNTCKGKNLWRVCPKSYISCVSCPSTSASDSQEPASPEKPKKKIVEDAQLEFHACLITSEKDWQTSLSHRGSGRSDTTHHHAV